MEYVLIHKNDNVKVCLADGHKYAVRHMEAGDLFKFNDGYACITFTVLAGSVGFNIFTFL